jgi:hypothetical protein
MKTKPYVGITGVTSQKEMREVAEEFKTVDYTLQTPHIPMVGVLVSYKTLNHQQTNNLRYPELHQVPGILVEGMGKVFPMIHYNSRKTDTLADQISSLFGGIYDIGLCRGLQLNIPWPNIAQVREIKKRFPLMKIVFQLSKSAMEGLHPEKIGERIKEYDESIDYVLIDPSGGRGKELQLNSDQKYLQIDSLLQEEMPDITIGFAGGLSGDNVSEKVNKIIEARLTTNFCIDAEGKLRDKFSDRNGDDKLNIDKVRMYLQSASSAL